jgi:hypothetical protein
MSLMSFMFCLMAFQNGPHRLREGRWVSRDGSRDAHSFSCSMYTRGLIAENTENLMPEQGTGSTRRTFSVWLFVANPVSPEPKAIDSRVLVGPRLPPGAALYFPSLRRNEPHHAFCHGMHTGRSPAPNPAVEYQRAIRFCFLYWPARPHFSHSRTNSAGYS